MRFSTFDKETLVTTMELFVCQMHGLENVKNVIAGNFKNASFFTNIWRNK